MTDGSGNALAVNSYDEYGIPASTNLGRFQYTGQAWLPELGLYYYKARMYSATLGRFMQTDPIGYADGPNWYNYVGGDPVNGADPDGLQDQQSAASSETTNFADPHRIIVIGSLPPDTRSVAPGNLLLLPGVRVGPDDAPYGIPPLLAKSLTPPKSKTRQSGPRGCNPSPSQMANSGTVTFRYSEANVSALGTRGDAFGTFRTSGGYSGTFHTPFDGVFIGGKGVGVSYGGGSSKSLATFNGVNYNLVATLGPYAISDNYDPNTGEHIGQTDAGSTLGLGIGGTRSNTTLVTVSCPRGN